VIYDLDHSKNIPIHPLTSEIAIEIQHTLGLSSSTVLVGMRYILFNDLYVYIYNVITTCFYRF